MSSIPRADSRWHRGGRPQAERAPSPVRRQRGLLPWPAVNPDAPDSHVPPYRVQALDFLRSGDIKGFVATTAWAAGLLCRKVRPESARRVADDCPDLRGGGLVDWLHPDTVHKAG